MPIKCEEKKVARRYNQGSVCPTIISWFNNLPSKLPWCTNPPNMSLGPECWHCIEMKLSIGGHLYVQNSISIFVVSNFALYEGRAVAQQKVVSGWCPRLFLVNPIFKFYQSLKMIFFGSADVLKIVFSHKLFLEDMLNSSIFFLVGGVEVATSTWFLRGLYCFLLGLLRRLVNTVQGMHYKYIYP